MASTKTLLALLALTATSAGVSGASSQHSAAFKSLAAKQTKGLLDADAAATVTVTAPPFPSQQSNSTTASPTIAAAPTTAATGIAPTTVAPTTAAATTAAPTTPAATTTAAPTTVTASATTATPTTSSAANVTVAPTNATSGTTGVVPTTVIPTTAIASTTTATPPTTASATTSPSAAGSVVDISACSISYTQSVTVNGNTLTAKFTPAPGATVPDFVDLHVSKNCPGNPTPSTGVCATAWYQPPFDQSYAINVHAVKSGTGSMAGASYNGKDFVFTVDISGVGIGADDALCYDFTYDFGSTGCDTGVCSLSPVTPAGFAVPLPTTCDALTYKQDVTITGNQIVAHFIPDAGKPVPTWVDIHVSKNCPGNPTKSNSTCATPWYQPPFDEAYALNLHAAQLSTDYSSAGASFGNGEFTFNFDASTLLSTIGSSDEFCYDFTYAYGNLGCDSGVCSLVEAAPSTSPIVVAAPSCSQVQYTQSVKVTGNQVLATFSPQQGSTIPTFVDFHITKNCPNSPSESTSQCATEWYQPPFDSAYALNLHNSAIGTYSSAGAMFNPQTNNFTFIFDASVLTNTLIAADKLCYDFTYAIGNYGCDTGVCSVSQS